MRHDCDFDEVRCDNPYPLGVPERIVKQLVPWEQLLCVPVFLIDCRKLRLSDMDGVNERIAEYLGRYCPHEGLRIARELSGKLMTAYDAITIAWDANAGWHITLAPHGSWSAQ